MHSQDIVVGRFLLLLKRQLSSDLKHALMHLEVHVIDLQSNRTLSQFQHQHLRRNRLRGQVHITIQDILM